MEQKRINFGYPFRVWLTAIVLIGPLLVSLYTRIAKDPYYAPKEIFIQALLFILYGLVFSLPVFGIYYFLFILTTRKQIPALRVKAIVNGLCVVGVLVTIKYVLPYSEFSLPLIYSASVIISSLFYKVYKKVKE